MTELKENAKVTEKVPVEWYRFMQMSEECPMVNVRCLVL